MCLGSYAMTGQTGGKAQVRAVRKLQVNQHVHGVLNSRREAMIDTTLSQFTRYDLHRALARANIMSTSRVSKDQRLTS